MQYCSFDRPCLCDKSFAICRAEDQVEIKMPPAYADIFASGAGFICPHLLSLLQCEPLGKETSVQQSRTQGAWALPQPTTLTLQVHRSQLPNHPRCIDWKAQPYVGRHQGFQHQVVVQVATPPPAGPVKKTYRKVKKTPVVPTPKPEDP